MDISSVVIAGVNAASTFWGAWLIVTGTSRLKRREADGEDSATPERTRGRYAVRRLQRRVFGGMVLNVVSLAGWIYLLAAFS